MKISVKVHVYCVMYLSIIPNKKYIHIYIYQYCSEEILIVKGSL